MARLQNKVAIITGAASGMGLAAAQLFVAEGAKVVATDVAPNLATAMGEISTDETNLIARTLDVASPSSWADTVAATLNAFGRIDILINNAGIHQAKGILEAELDDWNFLMGINCTGVWLGMKAVIPAMIEAGAGSIVNCSSLAAIVAGDKNDGGGAAYSASKGAVRSLTKHAAQQFAKHNIRVNSVHPGAIFTQMAESVGLESREAMGAVSAGFIPLPPHAGEPLDVAYGYLYLASDEAKFVTGIELIIDGGSVSQ